MIKQITFILLCAFIITGCASNSAYESRGGIKSDLKNSSDMKKQHYLFYSNGCCLNNLHKYFGGSYQSIASNLASSGFKVYFDFLTRSFGEIL